MSKLKFRAKSIDGGKWVYGYIYKHEPPLQCFLSKEKKPASFLILKTGFADWNMPRPIDQVEVDGATAGQLTGLKDIAGTDCYSDDIVKAVWSQDINDEMFGIGKVIFRCGCFMIEWIDDREANMELLGIADYKTGRPRVFKILGNAWENPELIKK